MQIRKKTHRNSVLHTKKPASSFLPSSMTGGGVIAWFCSAPLAQHPGMAKIFPISEPAGARHCDARLLSTETRPGKPPASIHHRAALGWAGLGCSLVLTALRCLLETALDLCAPASHRCRGGKPGRVALLCCFCKC